jgi:hypothetical protein
MVLTFLMMGLCVGVEGQHNTQCAKPAGDQFGVRLLILPRPRILARPWRVGHFLEGSQPGHAISAAVLNRCWIGFPPISVNRDSPRPISRSARFSMVLIRFIPKGASAGNYGTFLLPPRENPPHFLV